MRQNNCLFGFRDKLLAILNAVINGNQIQMSKNQLNDCWQVNQKQQLPTEENYRF